VVDPDYNWTDPLRLCVCAPGGGGGKEGASCAGPSPLVRPSSPHEPHKQNSSVRFIAKLSQTAAGVKSTGRPDSSSTEGQKAHHEHLLYPPRKPCSLKQASPPLPPSPARTSPQDSSLPHFVPPSLPPPPQYPLTPPPSPL